MYIPLSYECTIVLLYFITSPYLHLLLPWRTVRLCNTVSCRASITVPPFGRGSTSNHRRQEGRWPPAAGRSDGRRQEVGVVAAGSISGRPASRPQPLPAASPAHPRTAATTAPPAGRGRHRASPSRRNALGHRRRDAEVRHQGGVTAGARGRWPVHGGRRAASGVG